MKHLFILSLFLLPFLAQAEDFACEQGDADFTFTADGCCILFAPCNSAGFGTWSFGDGNSASGVQGVNHCYSSAGSYTVVHTFNGQTVTRTIFVGPCEDPDPPTGCEGGDADFNTQVNGCTVTFLPCNSAGFGCYYFGDGNSQCNVQGTTHTYSQAGTYTVTHTFMGQSWTETVTVTDCGPECPTDVFVCACADCNKDRTICTRTFWASPQPYTSNYTASITVYYTQTIFGNTSFGSTTISNGGTFTEYNLGFITRTAYWYCATISVPGCPSITECGVPQCCLRPDMDEEITAVDPGLLEPEVVESDLLDLSAIMKEHTSVFVPEGNSRLQLLLPAEVHDVLNLRYEVYSISGQMVGVQASNGNRIDLDRSLQPGVYVLQVTDGENIKYATNFYVGR